MNNLTLILPFVRRNLNSWKRVLCVNCSHAPTTNTNTNTKGQFYTGVQGLEKPAACFDKHELK